MTAPFASLLVALAVHAHADLTVSLKTLLPEMADLSRLCKASIPSYTEAQASSYDRASKTPGNDAWFANADAGQFLRVEDRPGRKEYVLADLRGPGTVVRFWSANPVGQARFYFDGESEARFSWSLPELLGGKVKPFIDPLSYFASRGANLYFPIPYAKSLKVTVDDSQGDGVRGLYYHIGYRTYAPTTRVKSLTPTDLSENAALITSTAKALADSQTNRRVRGQVITGHREDLLIGDIEIVRPYIKESREILGPNAIRGPMAIKYLALRFKLHDPPANLSELPWDDPRQLHVALRRVRLVADFDGERCIDVPVSDFFNSAAGPQPFATQPIAVYDDGWMACRFAMPFEKSARVRLVPVGGPELDVETMAALDSFPFDKRTFHFHAQWIGERTNTRPFRDMEFLNVKGEGRYVGTSLHIANPNGTWWGEGDEKVFVDGESFPSTFGTGSEDYFGYAWGNPDLFMKPFHAQPRCDGPGTRGHIQNVRWHLFDDIPYRESLAFSLELWHWAVCDVDYDRTAYWYAKPGGTPPKPANDPKKLWLTYIPKPEPVKGAVEGETAAILSKSGGETEIQEFGELSNGGQLWWRDMKPGDRLVLKVPVKEDGEYEVSGNFCMARDYGIHKLSLGGNLLSEATDFYSSGLEWKVVQLGRVTLKAGDAELVVECVGHRPEAIPRNMFGLDYLLLKKAG